jgi:hypothetical protein
MSSIGPQANEEQRLDREEPLAQRFRLCWLTPELYDREAL